MNNLIKYLLISLIVLFPPSLFAQFEDDTIGELTGEVLLQSENTSGLPGGREDLERTRLFLWLDLEAPINDNFSFGVSFYGNLGTDDEDDNRRNLDNSPSNTSEIDQAYLDWNFSGDGFLRVGRQKIPASLSSMLWDRDISTLGVSLKYDWLSEQDNEYAFTAGNYTVEHLFSEDTKLSFADFHFSIPAGDMFVSSGVTVMQVTDSEFLLQDNVQRTNNVAALQEGFEIVSADLSLDFSLFDQP